MFKTRVRRRTDIGFPSCLLGFDGRDSVDSAIFDTTTLSPGGLSETQVATITGGPTGGSFKFAFKGRSTAPIAYNAAASAVQSALNALPGIGAGGTTVTGSAGGPYTIAFGGKLANRDVGLLSVSNNSLTGGTSPTVGVTETVKGSSLFNGMYVITSGLPLMATADGKMVKEWDYANASDLLGIFDGLREMLTIDEFYAIPVYNHGATFDVAIVKNYAANKTKYDAWAAAHVCQFKRQK